MIQNDYSFFTYFLHSNENTVDYANNLKLSILSGNWNLKINDLSKNLYPKDKQCETHP